MEVARVPVETYPAVLAAVDDAVVAAVGECCCCADVGVAQQLGAAGHSHV